MNGANPQQRGSGRSQTHGLTRLKQAVSTLGSRSVDRRTSVGKALAAWRSELLLDLGGIENVTTQELALVDQVVSLQTVRLATATQWCADDGEAQA